MVGVLAAFGHQVSWNDFFLTKFSSLSLSLLRVDGDFFLVDPGVVLPDDGLEGWEAGSFN